MALIDIPAGLDVAYSDLSIEYAASTFESPYSFKRGNVAFGGARWRGILTIGLVGREFADTFVHETGFRIESFLDDISDPENTAELPVGRPAALEDAVAVSAVNLLQGFITIPAANPQPNPPIGSLLRVQGQDRTWKVRRVDGRDLFLTPKNILPAIGDMVIGTTTILGRMQIGASISSVRGGHFVGPWLLPWVEAI